MNNKIKITKIDFIILGILLVIGLGQMYYLTNKISKEDIVSIYNISYFKTYEVTFADNLDRIIKKQYTGTATLEELGKEELEKAILKVNKIDDASDIKYGMSITLPYLNDDYIGKDGTV